MYVSISIYIVYALRSNLRAAFARLMKIYRKRIKFIAESQVSFAFLPLENRTKEGPLSTSLCLPPLCINSRWNRGKSVGFSLVTMAWRHRTMLCIFIMPAHGNPLPQKNISKGCPRVLSCEGAGVLGCSPSERREREREV